MNKKTIIWTVIIALFFLTGIWIGYNSGYENGQEDKLDIELEDIKNKIDSIKYNQAFYIEDVREIKLWLSEILYGKP